MADGSTKPIEDVKSGDKVIATDPEAGQTRMETVTAEIKGDGVKHLVKVTIDTDGGQGSETAEVTATDDHPFWVPELDEWIDTIDLQPGHWLQTSAGTYVQITAIQHWTAERAHALADWCRLTGIDPAFIDPGSSWQNGVCEPFNGRFWDEFLACEQFNTLLEVQVLAEDRRIEYNTYRPHGSLDGLTPEAFHQQWTNNRGSVTFLVPSRW